MEDVRVLRVKLKNAIDEYESVKAYIGLLKLEIIKRSKFKVNQEVYIYEDPLNMNIPTWYKARILKVIIFEESYKYEILFISNFLVDKNFEGDDIKLIVPEYKIKLNPPKEKQCLN